MRGSIKKAILDTDYLVKTYLTQNSSQKPLADLIMQFEDYEFFCHEKIMSELCTNDFTPNPVPWLEEQISNGKIRMYSDRMILNEIADMFGYGAPGLYYDMLKASCATSMKLSGKSFFDTYYIPLTDLTDDAGEEEFLATLAMCDSYIPNGSGMGETKSLVLAQLMQLKYPGRVVVFCSDDGKARQRATYIGNDIKCLGISATFQKLLADGMPKEDVRQFFDSFSQFLAIHNQTTIKVWTHKSSEKVHVGFETLFEDICEGKFEIKGNGDLRYRQ